MAFADSLNTYVNSYVYAFAEEFVKNIDGGEIKDVIPIYDSEDNINSCCFTINKENEPYMYIILDNYYREGISPIIEMGFGDCNFDKNEKVVNLNYIDYGVSKNSKIEFNNQEIEPQNCKINYPKKQSVSLFSTVSVYDGYMSNLNDISLSKLALMTDHYFFEPFVQSDLATSSQIRDGICGATTAMNVLKFYGDAYDVFDDEIYYDPIGTYNTLRSYQTVDAGDNPYNISNQSKRKDALTKYINNNTSYKITVKEYLLHSWIFVYNDINNGKLVDYRYSGKEGGHCVLVVGAASSSSGSQFIYVADTWNKNLRWLNFNYHDNISCMSIKIYGY